MLTHTLSDMRIFSGYANGFVLRSSINNDVLYVIKGRLLCHTVEAAPQRTCAIECCGNYAQLHLVPKYSGKFTAAVLAHIYWVLEIPNVMNR